jgi:hypothetical protein
MTNGVEGISKAINDYGIAIVIMAVFFIVFLLVMVIILRNNAKMMDQLMKNQNNHIDQDIINRLVDNALENKDDKEKDQLVSMVTEVKQSLKSLETKVQNTDGSDVDKPEDYHKDLVGAYIDINMAFKDISRKTLNLLKCERIAIYVFHNGNTSMLGLPFFKMSCIHEWTTHGNNTLRGKSHVDMPLHLFNDFIEDLWNSGIYRSDSIDKSAEVDHSIKDFIAFSNTKSLYMISIKTDYGAMSGFVVAEFASEEKFTEDETRDNQVRTIIEDMIEKVAPIVSNKYIYRGKNNNE